MTAVSRYPAVELEDPSGRRVNFSPRSPEDRIGELADALGVDPRRVLRLDGRPVGRHETLAGAGLVRGSRLDSGDEPGPTPPEPTTRAPVVVVVEAGPDAGGSFPLGPGVHVVGRAAAASVSIADPLLEPHHALLDVAAGGTVHIVQLAGRVPARLAGDPVSGRTAVPADATVVLGSSRLRVHAGPTAAGTGAAITPAPADPWRRTLRRSPRVEPRWAPDPITLPATAGPATRPSAAGLAAAAVALGGSVAVAVVMGSPMFLVMGLVGGLASAAFWLAARFRANRDDRRAGRAGARDQASFAAAVAAQRDARWRHHLAVAPTLASAVVDSTSIGPGVWARRAGHADAFTATLGWGPVAWTVTVDESTTHAGSIPAGIAALVGAAELFDDAPVPVDLGPGAALAITGPGAGALARSLIVQLATWTGPADWRLIVVAGDPADWEWCRWLPHTDTGDGPQLVVAADDRLGDALAHVDDGDSRHVVLVTDRPDLLALRTGALRRFLHAHPSAAVLVAVPADDAVPALCRSVAEIGSIGLARWRPEVSASGPPGRIHVAGVTPATATLAARRLAGLHDPEDASNAAAAVPPSVTLSELRERHGEAPIDDAIAIAGTWRSVGPDPPPAAAIGLTGDGVVEIDLARDGPHALVAGTTGAGKSELLRTLVVSLAAGSSPDHLTFVLVDYKGGATFDACTELPHTVGVVTDLDERLAERALTSLEAELRRRERRLRAAGTEDLHAYRAVPGQPALPRLIVIIDEFAALAAELPGFVPALVSIAQRGRSLGIHLVLATQRPSGVVDEAIRANTNLRLALRLQDPADGRDVVGDSAPASFPRGTPGRAMLRLGPDEVVVFQTARSVGATAGVSELDVLVRAIRHAAALSDIAPPHRPWLPPLPARLGPGGCDGVALGPGDAGVLDDPSEQRRSALRWAPEDGHLALLGAVGSGTTTTLITLVAALARARAPQRMHVYVVDASGDHRLDGLDRLPHCGAVVRPHERERLARLLRRVVDVLDERRRAGGRGDRPHVVLAVDGVATLRGTLDRNVEELELLTRIVGEGPALGVACVLIADRPGAVPPAMLAACGERWVFRLDDPAEATLCGVPMAAASRGGPGRIVVASSRLDGQVAPIEPPTGGAESGGPVPVGTLPADVEAAEMPVGRHRGDGQTELVVGIEFHSLAPATLLVPDGEHVVVAGPPRSGRSTALLRLARSWRDAHPAGSVHAAATARGSPLAGWVQTVAADGLVAAVRAAPPDQPGLVLVDDAEGVDDDTGALARLVAERRPGLLVIAAGRPAALRTQYGQWTNVVRRSRLGLLMAACVDTDGDVLGELLPRRPPIPPRPGLAWVVGTGQRVLVQVGRDVSGS